MELTSDLVGPWVVAQSGQGFRVLLARLHSLRWEWRLILAGYAGQRRIGAERDKRERMRGLRIPLTQTQKIRLQRALQKLESLSSKANSNASVTVADSIPVNYDDGFLKYSDLLLFCPFRSCRHSVLHLTSPYIPSLKIICTLMICLLYRCSCEIDRRKVLWSWDFYFIFNFVGWTGDEFLSERGPRITWLIFLWLYCLIKGARDIWA